MILDWEKSCWRNFTERSSTFCVPIINLGHIRLGKVMKKNDGRWTWIRLKSNHFYETRDLPMQGVCATKEEAQKMAVADILELQKPISGE